jgi:magnesium-protoporphyrin O-methyltransferase
MARRRSADRTGRCGAPAEHTAAAGLGARTPAPVLLIGDAIMACSCCAFDHTADKHFTAEKVAKEVERYRTKGAGPTTRRLRDGLAAAGVRGGALLDVGGGFGGLSFELLDLGMAHASVIDASSAYLAAAAGEARRRGRSESIEFVYGDFVQLAEHLPSSTAVALDRVICCYPDYESLLEHAVRLAERALAVSYPRDRWFIRMGMWLENAMRKRSGNPFRTFVHPVERMEQIIERSGFKRVSRLCTIGWCSDVYVRRDA